MRGGTWTRASLAWAGAAVLWWAVLIVVLRAAVGRLPLDPWCFTFVQFALGGLVLCGWAGLRRAWQVAGTLARPATWGYGVLRVVTAAALTAALAHAEAGTAIFLGAVNVPLAAAAAWVLSRRRPGRVEIACLLVVLAAILALAAYRLPGGLGNPAVFWILLSELAVVGSVLLAERHPDNRAQGDPGARLALTGCTMLATGVAMAAAWALLGSAGLPLARAGDLLRPEIWLLGGLVGVLLRAPGAYLSFRAIAAVGGEGYVAALSLLPFSVLGLESAAAAFGQLPAPGTAVGDLALGALISGGSLLAARARRAGH